ncbi:MAG: DUF1036 domain-containing protein, partial [Flavobacteriales bacterium]|nr:DUF1036 domain-containing protein [Flavobacteriales bacterium]
SKIVKFQSVQLRNETKYPYLISFAWVNKKERICKGWYKVGVNEVLKFTLPKNFISNEIYFFGITNDENYKTSGSDNFFYMPKNIRKKNFTVINGEIKNGKGAIVRQGFKKIILSDSITKYRLLD